MQYMYVFQRWHFKNIFIQAEQQQKKRDHLQPHYDSAHKRE